MLLILATAPKEGLTLGLSISVKKATKMTSIKHNNRDFEKEDWESPYHEHINQEKSNQNIILVQTDIHEKYEELFGEAVKEYNDKQKRKDRKITDFYSKVKKDGNLELQREFIIQVGNKDDFTNNPKNWALANEVLTEYVQNFEQANPNLKIYNAVIHNDEASPHLHLNVIPVASGYKKGVALQPSFNKALKQQGIEFDSKNNRSLFINFRNQQVTILENSLSNRGISREMVGTNRLKDVREYKTAMKKVKTIEKQGEELHANFVSKLSKLDNSVNVSESELNRLDDQIERSKSILNSIEQRISEKKDILSEKETLVEKMTQGIEEDIKPYQIKLDRMEKLAKNLPDDSFYENKEDLYQIVADYLPNRLGTDRELKAQNIFKLIQQAQAGRETTKVMNENLKLRTENEQAIEQATAPLKQTITEQRRTIRNLEGWIDSIKDSLHTFKREFGNKYQEFLIHFGIKMKYNDIHQARGLAENEQESQLIQKGFNMNPLDSFNWHRKHDNTIPNQPQNKINQNHDRGMSR